MSYVSGPCSSLPDSIHTVPEGTVCDDHPDRPAFRRVQGETDSFGAEYHDMCTECYETYANRDRTEEQTGTCDWCKQHATDLRKHRDFEEGMAGPVYDVCGACVKRENDALEADRLNRDDVGYWDDYDRDSLLDADEDDPTEEDEGEEEDAPDERPLVAVFEELRNEPVTDELLDRLLDYLVWNNGTATLWGDWYVLSDATVKTAFVERHNLEWVGYGTDAPGFADGELAYNSFRPRPRPALNASQENRHEQV